MMTHIHTVQTSFTQQAAAYAANPAIHSAERIARLVEALQPESHQRVLEIASGPGHVALAIAPRVQSIVGVDLTQAFLKIARGNRAERGMSNAHFGQADVNTLPFADEQFDRAVCRFAFHHLPDPGRALGELARILRPGGLIVIEDMLASPEPKRYDLAERGEKLRDPSHAQTLSLWSFCALFAMYDLELESVTTSWLTQPFERWLLNAKPAPEVADEVRWLLLKSDRHLEGDGHLEGVYDFGGFRTYRDEAGEWQMRHRTGIVVGRKTH